MGAGMETHQVNDDIAVETLLQFTQHIRLISLDPARNRARFYLLQWQATLDGNRALLCTWGRIGTWGRSQAIVYHDHSDTHKHITGILRRRLKHGYRLLEWL
jgi:predicted DNA-binding WGR domain protein